MQAFFAPKKTDHFTWENENFFLIVGLIKSKQRTIRCNLVIFLPHLHFHETMPEHLPRTQKHLLEQKD